MSVFFVNNFFRRGSNVPERFIGVRSIISGNVFAGLFRPAPCVGILTGMPDGRVKASLGRMKGAGRYMADSLVMKNYENV